MARGAVYTIIVVAMAGGLVAAGAWAQQTPTTPAPAPTTPAPGQQPTEQPTQQPTQQPARPGAGVTQFQQQPSGPQAPAQPGGQPPTAMEPAAQPSVGPSGTRVIGPGSGTAGVRISAGGQEGSNEPYLNRELDWSHLPPEQGTLMSMTSIDIGGAMPALTFLDELHLATGWNILPSQQVEQASLRFWIEQMTPTQALTVLKANGIYYEYDPETNFLFVRTVEEQQKALYGEVIFEQFKLDHADLIDMEAILANLSSPQGRVVAEPRTGRLMVWDTLDNIQQMETVVELLDVPVQPVTFSLDHINVDDVVDSITEFLSERGVAQMDPRTNTITVTDLPQRIDKIEQFLEAIDIPLETRTWTLNYAEPEEIASRLEGLVPEEMGNTVVDETLRQVTITGVPARLDEIDELIQVWDRKRRQVEIEAYLVSTTATVIRNLGVNWFYFGEDGSDAIALTSGDQPLNFGRTTSGQLLQVGAVPFRRPLTEFGLGGLDNLADAVPVFGEGEDILAPSFGNSGISVVLEYLDQQGDVTILSRPRVTVIDGEEARFENTQDRPFQEGGFSQFTSTGTTDPNFNRVIPLRVQFITVGTILEVAPTINDENNILLDIAAEESTAEDVTVVVGDQQSTIPSKRQSRTETQVLVHDQQTLVIGGLRNSNQTDDVTRVPLLGDLPLIGRLFKTTEKDLRQNELMVFLTPTIVDEYTNPEADRLAKIDERVSTNMRNARKQLFERWKDKLSRGDLMFMVSIGQNGHIYAEGQEVDLEGLRASIQDLGSPDHSALILRAHPRAPKDVIEEVKVIAEQAGMTVKEDDTTAPFVPTYRDDLSELGDAPPGDGGAAPTPEMRDDGVISFVGEPEDESENEEE